LIAQDIAGDAVIHPQAFRQGVAEILAGARRRDQRLRRGLARHGALNQSGMLAELHPEPRPGGRVQIAGGLDQQGFADLPHAVGIVLWPGRQQVGDLLGQRRTQRRALIGQRQQMRKFVGGRHG